AVTDWTHAERPDFEVGGLGPPPDWGRLHRSMGEGGAVAEELAEVSELVVALLLPLRDAARVAESAARADVREAERALKEMEAERARLESEEEARPPVSRFLDAERDERAGAPFYELVDFVPDLEGPARAGLEAALEASGLLDAWVARSGLVVHPSTHDVILQLDAPVLPEGMPTLADALTAARPEVARLLRAVGLGDSADNPWIATDGRWSVGPLRGAWSKVEAEYLGAGARRATRDRRLAETTRRCAELSGALVRVGARFDLARGVRERLDNLPATLPDDTLVRRSASTALALAGVASDALSRAEEDRRGAQQARTIAAQARSELVHAASLDSLPVTMDGLDTVESAATDMARELHGWGRMWDEWDGRNHEVAELSARHAERVASADAAASDASALEHQHDNELASLAALEDAIGASVAEVLAAADACRELLEAAQQALPSARERARALGAKAGSALTQASTAVAAVEAAGSVVTAAGERLHRAAVLPGVSVAACGVKWEWDGSGVDDAARALQARVAERSEGSAASDQVVLNRYRELEDGLAGGYDVVASEEDGVKYFHVVDDTGRQPLPAVAARVATEAEQTRSRLLADEREVIERFLLGELGEEIRERLLESHDLVLAANRALAGVRTSHGKGAHLNWQIDPEASTAAREATQLLVMAPRAAEEDARLRDALMDLIRAQREKDPSLGYLAHLREALDYRYWHRFSVQAVDDARPGSMRVLSPRLGLSQGEQRVLSYLALFAAAAAHFNGLGASCPRLLLLDDAFAKVDEPTHGRLLKLLIELDLDFVMTSERMWGCFPEVPSLEIYEALREPLVPGVALVHFRWDGRQRHLIGM
ncbi:MAG: TIGR02680 family protein, partial [Acidimicrobiales bacterium]